MRSLRLVVAAIGLIATTAFASPADPKLGVEYLALATPQPVQATGKKVEVIEFFMYHCPHCNVLEPYLEDWVKKEGDNIVFKRVHMPYTGANDPEAHLYLTLEAMGKANEMQAKVFHAVHVEHIRLNRDEVILDWIGKQPGIDKAKFIDFWNSFSVQTKLKRLGQIINNYKVDSVPTLIVDGRYMTSPAVVDTANHGMNEGALSKATIEVLDNLVAKVAKTK